MQLTQATAASLLWDGAAYGVNPVLPPPVPQFVVNCTSVDDVVTAVSFALEYAVKLSVRANGHHQAGVALVQGGMTLNLQALKVGFAALDASAHAHEQQPVISNACMQ